MNELVQIVLIAAAVLVFAVLFLSLAGGSVEVGGFISVKWGRKNEKAD